LKNARGAASAIAAARAVAPSPALLPPEILDRGAEPPALSGGPVGAGKGKVRRFEMVLSPHERASLLALTDRADVAIRGAGSDEGVPVSRAEIMRALLGEVAMDRALEARVQERIRSDRS
jgi:hypothetical protein